MKESSIFFVSSKNKKLETKSCRNDTMFLTKKMCVGKAGKNEFFFEDASRINTHEYHPRIPGSLFDTKIKTLTKWIWHTKP